MAYLGRHGASAPLNSADIPDNSITAAKIVDGAVGVADIGENAVGTSEIADSVTLVTPNLGTVASGDLSNTALVFPTGHVLQVIQGTPNPTNYDSASFSEVTCTNWTATINKSISGSSIFATWHCTYKTYQGDSVHSANLFIDFDRTAPTSSTGINQQRAHVGIEDVSERWTNIFSGHSGSFVDTSTATGNHTYVAHIRGGSSSSVTPYGSIRGTEGESTLVLMEIVT